MKIILKKDIIKDLDTYSCAVYTALRYYYQKDIKNYYISINQLCYTLTGSSDFSRKFKDKIVLGLDTLIEKGLVTVVSNIAKHEYELDLSKLFFADEFFTMIDLSDVRKVCTIGGKTDKFGLLKYLITMIGTFNNSEGVYVDRDIYTNFVGYMPVAYIASECGISEPTALAYNDALEWGGIIFIYRHDRYTLNDKNEIRSICNHYGLKADQQYITEFAENYEVTLGFEKKSVIEKKAESNHNRALAQKYRCLCNGVSYDDATVEEIYEYIHTQNTILQKQIDEKVYGYENLIEKLRDESIFGKEELC